MSYPAHNNEGLARGSLDRRAVLVGALSGVVSCGIAQRTTAGPDKGHTPREFTAFLQSLWPLAQAQGVLRETFDAVAAGLSFDPSIPSGTSPQPEFETPLSAYVKRAVSPGQIALGRQNAARRQNELAVIETRFGVPAGICVAAWGMETGYGRDMGSRDIPRSLASLAYQRDGRMLFTDEFIAALVMCARGVPREKLKGSWAGAMGHPQFMPSAYLKYAVAYSGASPADIWDSVPDSLASIAHFLRESGWRPGLPWGMEVRLPPEFDFASLHMSFAAWGEMGLRAADERALPLAGEATLFLPSGAGGPAFLLSENYWVLKAYNNSDSYALSLALLSDRIAGGEALYGTWPAHEVILSRAEKAEMQRLLTAGGLYHGTVDGRFGPASRDAIHEFQRAAGLHPADGYGNAKVLQALRMSQGQKPL